MKKIIITQQEIFQATRKIVFINKKKYKRKQKHKDNMLE